MKIKLFAKLFLVLFLFAAVTSNADDKWKERPFLNQIKMEKLKESRKGNLVSLSIDILGGLGISNTSFEVTKVDSTTSNLSSTSSKIGPTFGANLSVNFFGMGFTTGFNYSSKGFETSNGTKQGLNYFNIPLLFYFNFEADKVRVDGNLGPYFGLLVSQDNSPAYSAKNFDFGLTGSIQGTYMFTKILGALLGLKYEYGGLNNLGNNEKIKSIRTSTFNIYTGLKIDI